MKLKRKIKKKIVDKKNSILMKDRFIMEGFYKYGNRENSPFRKTVLVALLYLTDKVSGVFRIRPYVAEKRKYTFKPCRSGPESSFPRRASYTLMSKRFLTSDIVSFDIFDTLILRPFDNPKSVFFLLGEKHKIPGFKRYRELSEKQARAEAMELNGNNEVTLREIYEKMQRYVIIDVDYAVKVECDTEVELCMENPYMKQVFLQAKNLNKRIIALSDMYLPKETIVRMLNKCGYDGFYDIIISNEHTGSKRSGLLYEEIREQYGEETKIIHIGDNFRADRLQARRNGIYALWYKGVNYRGNAHRAFDMTALIGSGYRGIVNMKLQSGYMQYDQYFEFGYTYAGFLVLGYCNYIHKYVENNGMDKVLFLSRDGNILKKVYDILYPNENTVYAYWSRSAAIKAGVSRFRNELLLRYIKYKIPRQMTLKKILRAMDLQIMQSYLDKAEFTSDVIVTKENYEDIVKVFCDNWEVVVKQYETTSNAAKKYYSDILEDSKNACIVDIGWAASGFSSLRYLIEDEWNLDCKVKGLLAGSTYLHDMDIIEAQIANGTIDAYMFSQKINREIRRDHNVRQMYGAFTEIMMSAPYPSFLGFRFDENGEVQYDFDLPETEGYDMIRQIHNGVMEFVDDYTTAFKDYPFMQDICGSDAYAVCRMAISHPDYFYSMFGDYPVNRAVGSTSFKFGTLDKLIETEFVK